MPVVRTDCPAEGGGGVYGHVIAKFSRIFGLPLFLTHGAPLRARAPLSKFLAITCNLFKAQEIGIGFGSASHWLKNWHETF